MSKYLSREIQTTGMKPLDLSWMKFFGICKRECDLFAQGLEGYSRWWAVLWCLAQALQSIQPQSGIGMSAVPCCSCTAQDHGTQLCHLWILKGPIRWFSRGQAMKNWQPHSHINSCSQSSLWELTPSLKSLFNRQWIHKNSEGLASCLVCTGTPTSSEKLWPPQDAGHLKIVTAVMKAGRLNFFVVVVVSEVPPRL